MSAPAGDLLDAVREDPELLPEEKETTLRFAKRERTAEVFTAEGGIGRRVLAHPHATIEGVTVLDGGARPQVPTDEVDGRDIVAVRASVPVGALKIQLTPRDTTQHAPIVTERVLTGVRGDE